MFRSIGTGLLFAFCLLLSGCRTAVPYGRTEEERTETEDVREREQAVETDTKETEYGILTAEQRVRIPEIRVTYGDPELKIPSAAGGYTLVKEAEQESPYHRAEEQTQTVIACGDDPLSKLAGSENKVPYVRLGTEIRVEFRNGTEPDYVRIEDLVLDEGGNGPFGSGTVKKEEVEPEEGMIAMILSPNLHALKSRDSSTYQKGGVFRGFRLLCEWENGSRAEYGWILRTDAVYGAEGKSAGAYLMPVSDTGTWITAEVTDVTEGEEGPVVLMTVENRLNRQLFYGAPVSLQRFDGTEWKEIPQKENVAWEEIAYILEGGKSAVLEVDIGQIFGELDSGYYVIGKEFTDENTGDSRKVSAGFQIVRRE